MNGIVYIQYNAMNNHYILYIRLLISVDRMKDMKDNILYIHTVDEFI